MKIELFSAIALMAMTPFAFSAEKLSDAQLDMVTGGVGLDLSTGYGIVSVINHDGTASEHVGSLHPFTAGTNVPAQAAASYYNPSFVADGLYTAGQSPYGNGNPSGNVGNNAR